MMKFFHALKASKSGASAAEYALIVAVMGGLVVAGALAFGNGMVDANTNNATALKAQATTSWAAP